MDHIARWRAPPHCLRFQVRVSKAAAPRAISHARCFVAISFLTPSCAAAGGLRSAGCCCCSLSSSARAGGSGGRSDKSSSTHRARHRRQPSPQINGRLTQQQLARCSLGRGSVRAHKLLIGLLLPSGGREESRAGWRDRAHTRMDSGFFRLDWTRGTRTRQIGLCIKVATSAQ